MAEVLLTDAARGVGALVADALDRLGLEVDSSEMPAHSGRAAAAEIWLARIESSGTRALIVNHCRLRQGGLSRRSLDLAQSVFAAAARSENVERVVLLSSGQIYGADDRLPTFVPEAQGPAARPGPSSEDLVELEQAARNFAEVRPDVVITILRVAETLGDAPHGILADHMMKSGSYVTVRLGFDPQVQFVTPHAVAAAVVHALTEGVAGIFNYAPADAVPLSAAISLVGRTRLPLTPALSVLAGAARRMEPWSQELAALLRHGRALDPARAIHAGFPEASSAAVALTAAIY